MSFLLGSISKDGILNLNQIEETINKASQHIWSEMGCINQNQIVGVSYVMNESFIKKKKKNLSAWKEF